MAVEKYTGFISLQIRVSKRLPLDPHTSSSRSEAETPQIGTCTVKPSFSRRAVQDVLCEGGSSREAVQQP